MVSSMKERNDKKAWAKYEKAGKKLMAKVMKKRKAIEKKYANVEQPQYGMDGSPGEKELSEVTKWYGSEIKKLREQYGIK